MRQITFWTGATSALIQFCFYMSMNLHVCTLSYFFLHTFLFYIEKMHLYLTNMAWLWLDTVKLTWYKIITLLYVECTVKISFAMYSVYRASVGMHAIFFTEGV